MRFKLYFDPAVALLKDRCDLDVTTHSRALQEVVWALAVATGRRVSDVDQVCLSLHEQGTWKPADLGFDELLIRQSYASLAKRRPVLKPFADREMKAALDQLAAERGQPP